jgi:hypothetical protein
MSEKKTQATAKVQVDMKKSLRVSKKDSRVASEKNEKFCRSLFCGSSSRPFSRRETRIQNDLRTGRGTQKTLAKRHREARKEPFI